MVQVAQQARVLQSNNRLAQLAEVTRQVQQAFNNTGVTAAQVNQATTAVNTAADAVKRRAPLVATGAVSKEEFANAKDALARAQSALQVAQPGSFPPDSPREAPNPIDL